MDLDGADTRSIERISSFLINPPRSATAQWMAIKCIPEEGSVVGKASTIAIEISPTPPLIFTGVKKCEIWRHSQHHSTLSRQRLKMQQAV